MKAITIRAPWAQLIFSNQPTWKDVENRDWPTNLRGTIAIHTSKLVDPLEHEAALSLIESRGIKIEVPATAELKLQAGAILGTVEIVDCVRRSSSLWFVGDYGFVLANPRRLIEPIHCRGALGFWDVPTLSLRLIEKGLSEQKESFPV